MLVQFPHHSSTADPWNRPRTLVIYGTFIDAPTPHELRVRRNYVCEVDIYRGKIVKLEGPQNSFNPTGYLREGVEILRLERCQAVAVGLVDCHVQYTFPEESSFKDPSHCQKTYSALLRRLLRNGTTTAVYFASNHLQSAKILAQTAALYGQRALVGKVCSDQHLPEYYVENTKRSIDETEEFIKWVKERWGAKDLDEMKLHEGSLLDNIRRDSAEDLIKSVVTPRFIPTCSWELLKELGKLANRYGVAVQSHAAESVDEVMLVAEMYPEQKRDIKVFSETGLLTEKTILAHCTHLSDAEVADIVKAGAGIVSCPFSNMLFARSVVDIPRYYNPPKSLKPTTSEVLPKPLNLQPNLSLRKISLGTDIAGGPSSSLWTNIRLAVVQDRIPSFRNLSGYPLASSFSPASPSPSTTAEPPKWEMTHTYAYHIATVGGAATIGMEELLGVWEIGRLFDGFLVDWNRGEEEQGFDLGAGEALAGDDENESEEEWLERVKGGWERFVMGGDDRNILRVWVDGKEVCRRS